MGRCSPPPVRPEVLVFAHRRPKGQNDFFFARLPWSLKSSGRTAPSCRVNSAQTSLHSLPLCQKHCSLLFLKVIRTKARLNIMDDVPNNNWAFTATGSIRYGDVEVFCNSILLPAQTHSEEEQGMHPQLFNAGTAPTMRFQLTLFKTWAHSLLSRLAF